MNRRDLLKRGAGLAVAGGMAAIAGCQAAQKPRHLKSTANMAVEAEGENTFIEVSGVVAQSSQYDGYVDKAQFRVELLQNGEAIKSKTKTMQLGEDKSVEYTVTFSPPEGVSLSNLEARCVVLKSWDVIQGDKDETATRQGSSQY